MKNSLSFILTASFLVDGKKMDKVSWAGRSQQIDEMEQQ